MTNHGIRLIGVITRYLCSMRTKQAALCSNYDEEGNVQYTYLNSILQILGQDDWFFSDAWNIVTVEDEQNWSFERSQHGKIERRASFKETPRARPCRMLAVIMSGRP